MSDSTALASDKKGHHRKGSGPEILVVRGSLIDQEVEAIVNAANTAMRGGSGLDGAIHRAAGSGLREELYKVAPHGCKTGQVIVTGGHNLKHRYIIHTPGPYWSGGIRQEDELLAQCYRNSALAAMRLGVKTIGFPSISTGVYRFPLERAADIAIREVMATAGSPLEKVVFAMFGDAEYEAFIQKIAGPNRD
jgi:O-acetyl-ADP-ribose deacetylase (regulator of RNase III)